MGLSGPRCQGLFGAKIVGGSRAIMAKSPWKTPLNKDHIQRTSLPLSTNPVLHSRRTMM